MNRFTSLSDQKFRFLGLMISAIAITLLIILLLLDFQYEEGWRNRILIINHFIIVFGLIMIMYSKETFDDERVHRIRYTLLKGCYVLTISGVLMYISISTLDRVDLSIYIILYIVEAVLILYQLMFRYSLAKNPGWIFKERTQNNFRFYIMSFSLLFLIAWVIYCVIQFKL